MWHLIKEAIEKLPELFGDTLPDIFERLGKAERKIMATQADVDAATTRITKLEDTLTGTIIPGINTLKALVAGGSGGGGVDLTAMDAELTKMETDIANAVSAETASTTGTTGTTGTTTGSADSPSALTPPGTSTPPAF